MKKIELMKVEAFDSKGNVFEKTVTIHIMVDRIVVCFGWPIQFTIDQIVSGHPYQKDFCIDMFGAHHNGQDGWPVCVSKDDMDKIALGVLSNFGGEDERDQVECSSDIR